MRLPIFRSIGTNRRSASHTLEFDGLGPLSASSGDGARSGKMHDIIPRWRILSYSLR